MRNKLLLLLLLLLPAWATWAQAPAWQSVTGLANLAGGYTIVTGSAVNAGGDYYVVGQFYGSLTLGNTTLNATGGASDQDFFLAKFSNTTNNWVWAVKGGGSAGADFAMGVAVSGNNVYVTGYYNTAATISNTSLTTNGGSSTDVFVAKYVDNATSVAEAGALSGGGTAADQSRDITARTSGGVTSIYVTGFITTNLTTPTNVSIAGTSLGNNGLQDLFVARYTDSGAGLTNGGARSGGGTSNDIGRGITVNGSSVYVVGSYTAAATISGTSLTAAGGAGLDLFVAKYTDTGAGLSENGARSGGSASTADVAYSVDVVAGSPATLYVTGTFNGTANIGTSSLTSQGGTDIFIAKYTDSGTGLTDGPAIRDGGPNADRSLDIDIAGSTIYVVGDFTSTSSIAGTALTSVGSYNTDAYIAKYTDSGAGITAVGAISGGSTTNATSPTTGLSTNFSSTVAAQGNQAFVAGTLAPPALFRPTASGGSITVASGNSAFVATLTPTGPVLTSVNPTSGSAGTSITLTGRGLTGVTAVTFSGSSNNTVTTGLTVSGSGSSQTITVTVPSGAVTGNVTVTVGGSTSNGVAFTVASAPSVTTAAATSIGTTSAVLGGNVTSDGGATVSSRGVVFSSTTTTPVIGGSGVTQATIGSGTGSFSQSLGSFTAGTLYYVRTYATNSVGTSYGATVTFTTVAALATTGSQTNVSCNGGTDGSATVSVTGGIPPYTYSWNTSPAQTTATATGLAAGTYTVTVTDASGATISRSFTITQPMALTAATSQNNVTTNGGTNGSATITVSGGAGSYTYSWSPNVSTTATASNLSAGTYTVTATDANGCPLARTFTITQPAATTAVPVVTAPANGALLATTTPTYGGTAPAGSTVTVYVDGSAIGTTTATGGSFSLTQPAALTQGSHTVYATAQLSGQTASANSNTNTFMVDTVAPTVTSVSVPSNGTYRMMQTLNFTVNFSEPVTVTGTQPVSLPQLGLTIGSTSRQAGYVSGSGTAALVFAYTVGGTDLDTDGIAVGALTLNGGTIRDAVGNNATLTLHGVPATTGILVDGVVPTVVSINRQAPTATVTNASSVTFRVTFSEPVTGVGSNDFTLTLTGTASASSFSPLVTVSSTVYDLTVNSVSGDGTLRLDLFSPAVVNTGITDLAGNAIASGYTGGQAYTLDNTAPVATLSTTAGSSTSTSPIPFSVSFSESVTGFSASGIAVTNGTVTGGTVSGSGPYTFTVTPTANGTVTVSIRANAAQDATGNGNPASAAVSVTYTAPVTATTWTGTISPDWFTAGNWSAGVPTATINATISASAPFQPAIASGTATTRGLTLNSGATLNMSDGTLDVRANLTNNGTFVPTGGTVVLGTTTQPNIVGSGRVRFWNLTVNSSGVLLSTSAGASVRRLLTLNGAFVTQSNDFVLESDATGTALVVNANSSGVVSGPATVQRYTDASGNTGTSGYRHYSAPVSGATVSSLSTSSYGGSFTAQVNAVYNTADPNQLTLATYPNVFGYDASKIAGSPAVSFSDFDKGYQSPASLSDPLTVGRGYAVQIGNAEKVQFTGPLNNNTQTINNLTYAAAVTSGAASAGWALVGNPYPAPLDWRTVGTATGSSLNGVDGAAYVFQSTSAYSGRYTSFTNNVGAGSGLIASGQGFFVRASTPGTTGSITLTNANRVTSYANPAFQRTTAENRPLLRLNLGLGSQPATTATAQDETFVYFETGATDSYDGKYDAYKLINPNGYYLGSATPGSTAQGLSIDGRAPLAAAATTTEIPLWVRLPAGTYTLTATELLNFNALAGGTTVQLRDALLGTLTDLATTPSYSFSMAANAAYAGRFSLVFRPANVLATSPSTELAQAKASLYPNPAASATTLSVTGLPTAITDVQVEVLDVLGRAVAHYTLPVRAGSAQQRVATDQLAGSLYLLRLTARDAQGQVQGTLPTQRLTLSR